MTAKYSDVVTANSAILATVTGLKVRIVGEPTSLQETPAVYTLFEDVRYTKYAQVWVRTYHTLIRVCVRWQDNQAAELELAPFVDSIPDAFDAAGSHLNNTIPSGQATLSDGSGGFVTIDGTEYRCIDFHQEALIK